MTMTPKAFEALLTATAVSHGLTVVRCEIAEDDLGAGLAVVDLYVKQDGNKAYQASESIRGDLLVAMRDDVRVGYYEKEEEPGIAMLEFDAFFLDFKGN